MRSGALTFCLVGSVLWTVFFLFGALLMGSGFADEPGDTNGLGRFGVIFLVFVLPGVAVTVITARAMHAQNRAPQEPHGFPVEPLPGPRGSA